MPVDRRRELIRAFRRSNAEGYGLLRSDGGESYRPSEGDHILVRYDVTGGMDDARVRGTVKTVDDDEVEIDPDDQRTKTATIDMRMGTVAALKDGGSGTGMLTLRGELNSIEPDDADDDR